MCPSNGEKMKMEERGQFFGVADVSKDIEAAAR
jgi:hypothetical protein